MNLNDIKTLVYISLFFLFGMGLYGQNLKNHQWRNRVLILKTTEKNSKIYKAQLQEFKNLSKEFGERKLVLYYIVNDKYSAKNFINVKSVSLHH